MTRPISSSLPISYSREVAAAKARGAPIVALESTIISHGMPYPQNVETARAVEAIVREGGAVPATIAIIGGELKVGLTADAYFVPSSGSEYGTYRDFYRTAPPSLRCGACGCPPSPGLSCSPWPPSPRPPSTTVHRSA